MTHVVDWRLNLMLSHPRLFEVMRDEPHLSFGYPLCGSGWRDLLDRLCVRIEGALQENESFQFVRIKQKFGILRVDWDGEVPDPTRFRIGEAINLAVARSGCTCETCGAVGRRYVDRGWLATACIEHAVGDPAEQRHGENVYLLRRVPGRTEMYLARYDREADTLTEVPPPASFDTEDR
jgi:hypothetical protein